MYFDIKAVTFKYCTPSVCCADCCDSLPQSRGDSFRVQSLPQSRGDSFCVHCCNHNDIYIYKQNCITGLKKADNRGLKIGIAIKLRITTCLFALS